MRELDCEYYARRHREERARAETATDPTVRQVHRDFAAAYERWLHDDMIERPRLAMRH